VIVVEMALSKAEKERLDYLEHTLGIAIGFMLGGPAGASLGNAAVTAHQMSPFNQFAKDALFSTLPQRTPEQIANSPLMALPNQQMDLRDFQMGRVRPSKKKKRRASAYSKRYGKCFKKLQSKYKKKNGEWKKDGFKRCAAAARRCAKK